MVGLRVRTLFGIKAVPILKLIQIKYKFETPNIIILFLCTFIFKVNIIKYTRKI